MHAMKSVQPIFYGAEFKETLVDANQAYKTTVEEAANIGWRSGVAFPFRGGFEGEIAGASFGFNLDREKFLDYFDAHGEALNVIGARFHFEFVIRVSREERQRFNLTERQKSVLALSAEGLAQKAIADRLQISSRTVEGHLRNIRKILECASLEAAIARASWFHLLDPPAPKPL
jgi:DNA-binding CsgD family transcriptional regulator